jgi:hypothetical protein
LLQECVRIIIKNLNWGDPSGWVYKDFEMLSDMIFEHSGIRMSARTLRRIVGHEKAGSTSNPQLETKNALAVFAGYKNWKDFVEKHAENAVVNDKKTRYKITLLQVLILVAVVLIAVGGYYIFTRLQNSSRLEIDKIIFRADKVSGYAPMNVTFTYDITNVKDDLTINYGVHSENEKLEENNNNALYSYKVPGKYHVRVFSGEKMIADQHILVMSKDWKALVVDTKNYYPVKIDSSDNLTVFQQSLDKISHVVDMSELWFKYIYFYPFDFELDNMHLMIRMCCYEPDPNPCPDLLFRLFGENTASANGDLIQVHFVPDGCQKYLSLKFSERIENGGNNDLSVFQRDISQWHTYGVKTKDGVAAIYFENELLDTFHYHNLLGKFQGMQLKMKYQGSVDYVKVLVEDSVVYFRDF